MLHGNFSLFYFMEGEIAELPSSYFNFVPYIDTI